MENYSDIPGSLRIPHQAELDAKKTIINEAALKNLGSQDNLAYTYGEGIQIYCQEEKTRWEWKEAIGELQGLLPLDFTYPDGWIGDGIDYSLKSFNFFPVLSYLNLEDKLDKGNYVGTAEDLDNEIQNLKKPNIVLRNITPTIVGLNISAPADSFEWRIDQVVFDNTPALAKTLRAASVGFYRKDALLGTDTNSYLIVEGIEGDESVISPSVFPEGTILLGTIDVFGDSATGFLVNDTSKVSVFGNGGDTDYVEVNKLGSTFDIRNATSLTGFTIPSANIQYGKDYYLRNSTGGNLTLKSLIGSNSIRFYFPDGDLVVPLNNNVHLKYLSNNEFGGLGYLTLVGIDYRNKVDKVLGYTLTKNDLSDILKASYDSTVTWINTNGSNLTNHISRTDNPHSVTALQVGAPSGSGTSIGINTGDQDLSSLLIKNTLITGNTKTKITYDAKGLVINGADLVASDIPNITQSQVINLSTTLDSKQNLSEKNIANGYAGLGSDGKILVNQLPSITISDTFVIASQAAMLAIIAETGDIAVRTDLNKSFILKGSSPTVLENWQELLTPTSAVTTVFGRNGAVTAQTGDYTATMVGAPSGSGTSTGTNTGDQDLSTKVDKVTGKSLLSDAEITRLATLANYTHPANHPPSIITQDGSNRFVTDAEKTAWNAKQSAIGYTTENIANKNVANGYAGLGSNGKLIASQLPSITISDTYVVASQTLMLGLTGAEKGDIAVRTDLNKSFILKGNSYSTLADWQELLTPTSSVTTVFGRAGAIQALSGDYTTDQVTETATKVFQTPLQRLYNDATSSIQTQLNSKEALIGTKLTAFNKNFGTTVGTVAEGNDSRILNGQTAFGWGNHSGLYPSLTGTGANGTWGINISGSSTDSNRWGGRLIDNNNSNPIYSVIAQNSVTSQYANYTVDSFRIWLGLGSNAYTSTAYLPLTGGALMNASLGNTTLEIRNSSYHGGLTAGTVSLGFGYSDHLGAKIEVFKHANNRSGFKFYTEDGYSVSKLALTIRNDDIVTFVGSVTATAFYQSSDRRLKNILKRDGDVAYFKWKDGRDSKTHIGYVAQEVRKTNPDQVQKGEDKMLSVNYVEILVEKIRMLEKRIEVLEGGKNGI